MANALKLYGANWCPDCRHTKIYLGEMGIDYTWIDVDGNPEANDYIAQINNGKRVIPTIELASGEVLINPSNAQLAEVLGIKNKASKPFYDLVIVGSGPAGLTASFYCAREGLEVLVIERGPIGGQVSVTDRLDNFPGFPEGISGREFSERLEQQAVRFGVELLRATEVTLLEAHQSHVEIAMADGRRIRGRAVLIATGSTYRRLNVPGEEKFIGAGVHFCATCDGPFYKDKSVAVIGGGNSAGEESLFLTRFAKSVDILVRGEEMSASQLVSEKVYEHPKIRVHTNTTVKCLQGDSALSEIVVKQGDAQKEVGMKVDGAFVFIGLLPNVQWLPASIDRDERGFVVTRQNLETSLPGVFAAGDVRHGSTKQAASAAGEGATAALMIREYLKAGQ